MRTVVMLERILPGSVRWAETFKDRDVPLFPSESAAIVHVVEERKREFTTVRACARQALSALGTPAVPIVPGSSGAPRWPTGVVGSMTHCAGYRAAAVASRADVAGLGIDAEPHQPLPDGVLALIAQPEEQAMLRRFESRKPVAADRVLFSAKESVYKAWFPLTGRWLDFTEASVTIETDGSFVAELLVPGPIVGGHRLTSFTGRWAVRSDVVVTSILVPAIPPGALLNY